MVMIEPNRKYKVDDDVMTITGAELVVFKYMESGNKLLINGNVLHLFSPLQHSRHSCFFPVGLQTSLQYKLSTSQPLVILLRYVTPSATLYSVRV